MEVHPSPSQTEPEMTQGSWYETTVFCPRVCFRQLFTYPLTGPDGQGSCGRENWGGGPLLGLGRVPVRTRSNVRTRTCSPLKIHSCLGRRDVGSKVPRVEKGHTTRGRKEGLFGRYRPCDTGVRPDEEVVYGRSEEDGTDITEGHTTSVCRLSSWLNTYLSDLSKGLTPPAQVNLSHQPFVLLQV